jgi:hypothetical protein
MLASSFYDLAGIPAAKMRYGDDGTEDGKIFSEILPGDILANTKLTPETKKQIQDGFVIDAWLANWDVAGLGNDNIVINDKGEAFRIDVGGSLLFRAQGGDKGDKFSDEVTEIDTLRDYNRNPRSGALFGDMTDEDLKASAAKLLEISSDDIDSLVDAAGFDPDASSELKSKLKARRNNILQRLNIEDPAGVVYEDIDLDDVTHVNYENNPEYKDALGYYMAFGYKIMNYMLRGGKFNEDIAGEGVTEEEILKRINNLKEMLNSTIINKNIKAYRYQKGVETRQSMEVGAIWESKGFLSTSVWTDTGEQPELGPFEDLPFHMEINIPEGSRGGGILASAEGEVLLPPNSKFIVDSIEEFPSVGTRNPYTKVTLTLVSQDE